AIALGSHQLADHGVYVEAGADAWTGDGGHCASCLGFRGTDGTSKKRSDVLPARPPCLFKLTALGAESLATPRPPSAAPRPFVIPANAGIQARKTKKPASGKAPGRS